MKHALTALALLAALPGLAAAETDGTLGASSTGSLNLSLEVQEQKRIQITGFKDFEQSIERGVSVGDARDFADFEQVIRFGNTNGLAPATEGLKFLCVRMDDAGLYTLNWEATPLTSGPNTEEYNLLILAGENRNAEPATTIFFDDVLSSAVSGTVTGLQSRGFGTNCTNAPGEGKISVSISNGSTFRTFDTVGTYEATITLTVSPE